MAMRALLGKAGIVEKGGCPPDVPRLFFGGSKVTELAEVLNDPSCDAGDDEQPEDATPIHPGIEKLAAPIMRCIDDRGTG
jgi:hypothetical protein